MESFFIVLLLLIIIMVAFNKGDFVLDFFQMIFSSKPTKPSPSTVKQSHESREEQADEWDDVFWQYLDQSQDNIFRQNSFLSDQEIQLFWKILSIYSNKKYSVFCKVSLISFISTFGGKFNQTEDEKVKRRRLYGVVSRLSADYVLYSMGQKKVLGVIIFNNNNTRKNKLDKMSMVVLKQAGIPFYIINDINQKIEFDV